MNIEKSRSNAGHKKMNLNVFLSHSKYKVDMSLKLKAFLVLRAWRAHMIDSIISKANYPYAKSLTC